MWCTSLDQQPLFNNNIFMSLYFVVFVLLCVFFVLNMVIGVAIDQFNRMKRDTGKSVFLTDSQEEWVRVQRMMTTTIPKRRYLPPDNPLRLFCFRISMNEAFDSFMVVVIMMNVLVMCLTHYGQGPNWDMALSKANIVFTGIFVLEMLLKWMAIGIPLYFKVCILDPMFFFTTCQSLK